MTAVAPRTRRTIADLPGPRGLPLLGNLHQVDLPRLHQQLEAWAAEYGPIYRLRMGGVTRVCIADSEAIATMLRERPDVYRRRKTAEDVMAEMGFNGVFSQDGENWRRQRRVVVQALNPAHVAAFYPAMVRTTERLLGRWRSAAERGEVVDPCRDLMRYTVDVTAHLAFGIDVNTLETDGPVIQQHLDKVFPMLFRRVTAPFPYWRWFKRAADRELDRALGEIRAQIVQLTADCRARMEAEPARYEHPANFLEAVLAANREEGMAFADDEIYANVLTLLLAGEDTTANTLAWCVKYLIDEPHWFARLRAEADAALGDAPAAHDLDTLRRLDQIEAFTQEVLRLRPVAPLQGIEPKQDVELLGCHLPTGTEIIALTRPAALDDGHFGEARRFAPERWLEEATVSPHDPRASIPFGAGPRFCPGRGLALIEIKTVLAMLCRNFELAHADAAREVHEKLAFTMAPEGLAVRLRLRTSAP